MARAGNLHSRVVAWLKVILPLAALASLSLLFMIARTVNPEDAIPYAQVDVADRLREPRITQPTYAGMTSDGAALTVEADEARPDNAATGTTGNASGVRGRLETPDGTVTDLLAAAAQLDDSGLNMILSGGVQVTNSGYVIEAPEMTTALKATDVTSGGGEVTATGPVGDLRADQMHLTLGDKGYLLVFNGGVRLVYQPPN